MRWGFVALAVLGAGDLSAAAPRTEEKDELADALVKQYDPNGDGLITIAEITAVLSEEGGSLKQGIDPDFPNRFLADIDRSGNGDGVATVDEARGFFRGLMEGLAGEALYAGFKEDL